jgi:uncharacterized protein
VGDEARRSEVEDVVERFSTWAARKPDVLGLALVGSRARGTDRPDSDVDLVVLVEDVAAYVETEEWARELGATAVVRTRRWGPLVERRARLASGLEIEVGIVEPSWASVDPVDAGTRRVVLDGFRILHDPHGLLGELAVACGTAGPSPP